MKKTAWQILFWFQLLWMIIQSTLVYADAGPDGVGLVASNLMGPVGLMSDFVYSGCLLIGSSFIFASIIKYFEYRRSPLMVPISTVIFLLIAGLVLVLLPILSLFSDGAIRYSLFR